MSRIGKQTIAVPDKVKITVAGSTVKIEGPKGKLEKKIPTGITIEQKDNTLTVVRSGNDKSQRAYHGLVRALLQNMVTGVSAGFTRKLEIHGTGYRAEMKGEAITFNLGYSHPIDYPLPKGVTADVDKKTNEITLNSHDKELLGFVAAELRALRPPEPYKQKGVRYSGEKVRVKVGKTGTK